MNHDWITFHPESDILYVEVFVDKLVDYHSKNSEIFTERVIEVVESVTRLCEERGLKQVATANLEGVNFYKINLISLSKLVWKLYTSSKECSFVKSCKISNSGPIFNCILKSLRPILPSNMVSLIDGPDTQNENE